MEILFFSSTSTLEIYTLSLHDALPISAAHRVFQPETGRQRDASRLRGCSTPCGQNLRDAGDRKSTRLNSSHVEISYAVFCLKRKKFYLFLLSFNRNIE